MLLPPNTESVRGLLQPDGEGGYILHGPEGTSRLEWLKTTLPAGVEKLLIEVRHWQGEKLLWRPLGISGTFRGVISAVEGPLEYYPTGANVIRIWFTALSMEADGQRRDTFASASFPLIVPLEAVRDDGTIVPLVCDEGVKVTVWDAYGKVVKSLFPCTSDGECSYEGESSEHRVLGMMLIHYLANTCPYEYTIYVYNSVVTQAAVN